MKGLSALFSTTIHPPILTPLTPTTLYRDLFSISPLTLTLISSPSFPLPRLGRRPFLQQQQQSFHDGFGQPLPAEPFEQHNQFAHPHSKFMAQQQIMHAPQVALPLNSLRRGSI